MNTKQIVWQFFCMYILKAMYKNRNVKVLTYDQLMNLITVFGKVYDNRSAKHYIDCMVQNGWLIQNEANPLDILGAYVVTSVQKYKHMTWTINDKATFDLVDEEKILDQILK